MTRDMTITVQCDGRGCREEIEIDLDDGSPYWDGPETRIEKALDRAGWYSNMDGDYCKKCAEQAQKDWSKQ